MSFADALQGIYSRRILAASAKDIYETILGMART
jgi:hypothetical protein